MPFPSRALAAIGTFLFALSTASAVTTETPFDAFFSGAPTKSTVRLSLENKPLGSGAARLRFRAGKVADTANLTIRGTLTVNGVKRPLRTRIAFRPEGLSLITNLAPGYEDGHSAAGTFEIVGRRIQAVYPFHIRTTMGTATLAIQIREIRGRRVLLVTHTVSSSTLAAPLVWRFSLRARQSETGDHSSQ